ncbi:hypothetical protein BGZ99_008217 [Dissophora globulifera]|uniref:Uncharacterized protein n=1 Tax=Dissophora globulifera TaxID=979702 RepID=A0A9P6UPT0_9FUNG|nr:hypothetical protein BGZ99_008217 [Dissophora globulifera]
MEETQSFRLIGTTDIEEITCHIVGEQNVVYWEDIEQVFPSVKHVRNGNVTASMMRDLHGIRITPHRIKHFPGVVLDVILSTTAKNHQVDPRSTLSLALADVPAHIPIEAATNAACDPRLPTHAATDASNNPPIKASIYPHLPDDAPADAPAAALAAAPAEGHAEVPAEGSNMSSTTPLAEFVASLPIAAGTSTDHLLTDQVPGFQRTVIHKLDALYDQGDITQQIAQKVLQLSEEMKSRLILIQSKTGAILNQQLELIEYPIPRLFIVLPEEVIKYDPRNWFRTKFRLHFICECGNHTEPSNSKVRHHLHLAKHEGYLIREPTAFFKKYGPFLLLMLELIKFGTSVTGHVVPALASLRVVKLVDSVQHTVKTITAKID